MSEVRYFPVAELLESNDYANIHESFDTAVLCALKDMLKRDISDATVTLKLDIVARVDTHVIVPDFAYKVTVALTSKSVIDGQVHPERELTWDKRDKCFVATRPFKQQVEMFEETKEELEALAREAGKKIQERAAEGGVTSVSCEIKGEPETTVTFSHEDAAAITAMSEAMKAKANEAE